MSPEVALGGLRYFDGTVDPADHHIAGEGLPVVLPAGWVEAPVFPDAVVLITGMFPFLILLAGTGRCDLQDKVGGPALDVNGVPTAGDDVRHVHIESYHQVGDQETLALAVAPAKGRFTHDQGGVQASEVLVQAGHVSRLIEIQGVVHILTGREFREMPVRRGLLYLPGGHGVPRNTGERDRVDNPVIIRHSSRSNRPRFTVDRPEPPD